MFCSELTSLWIPRLLQAPLEGLSNPSPPPASASSTATTGAGARAAGTCDGATGRVWTTIGHAPLPLADDEDVDDDDVRRPSTAGGASSPPAQYDLVL